MKPDKNVEMRLWEAVAEDRYGLVMMTMMGMAGCSVVAIAFTILLMVS